MHAPDTTHAEFEELASGESNGIAVQLLWARMEDSVVVAVSDHFAGAAFAIGVGDSSPMDVFNHPYAYAAVRRVPIGERAEAGLHAA
jgi:hypothetical protein